MRFHYVIISLLLFVATLPVLAQEQLSLKGELNLGYSHLIGGKSIGLGGYGADFHATIPSMARLLEPENIWAKQPLFNLGAEGVLLLPLHQNTHVRIYNSLSYALKYSHERYHFEYPTQWPAAGGIQADSAFNFGKFGGKSATEDISINALVNHFEIGVRIEHTKSKLYGNVGLGLLVYTPFNINWKRNAINADGSLADTVEHSVWFNQSKNIDDNGEAGVHSFHLRGTAEFMATLSGRVGYGPIYLGVTYATNMRVNTVSVDVGFTIHKFGRSN